MQFECIEKHILLGISDYFRLFSHRCSQPLTLLTLLQVNKEEEGPDISQADTNIH